MDRWRRIVDHLLGEVIGDGDISHLPCAGKPLQLDDDPHTPGDQRATLKIMQDHNVSPEWISRREKPWGKMRRGCLKRLNAKARQYIDESPSHSYSDKAGKAPTNWSRCLLRFRDQVERHNRQVLLYNLKAPKWHTAQADLGLRCANSAHPAIE